MKPLHVALLVIGAALAGGLAVKVTQPPAMQETPPAAVEKAAPEPDLPKAVEAPQPAAPHPEAPPVAAPPPVYEQPKRAARGKPHPFERERPTPAAPAVIAAAPLETASAQTAPPTPPIPYQPPPTPTPVAREEPAPAPPPPPPPQRVTLREGAWVAVRLDQSISSERSNPGDTFQASLAEPLVVDGLVIAEKGARATGRVVSAQKAGRATGMASVEIVLSTFETADGQKIAISTDSWSKRGESPRNESAAKVGGGAALGAIVGAIAGGGKGAAIGAGLGGGLGAGAVAMSHGKPVDVPSETIVRFRLNSSVSIIERQF